MSMTTLPDELLQRIGGFLGDDVQALLSFSSCSKAHRVSMKDLCSKEQAFHWMFCNVKMICYASLCDSWPPNESGIYVRDVGYLTMPQIAKGYDESSYDPPPEGSLGTMLQFAGPMDSPYDYDAQFPVCTLNLENCPDTHVVWWAKALQRQDTAAIHDHIRFLWEGFEEAIDHEVVLGLSLMQVQGTAEAGGLGHNVGCLAGALHHIEYHGPIQLELNERHLSQRQTGLVSEGLQLMCLAEGVESVAQLPVELWYIGVNVSVMYIEDSDDDGDADSKVLESGAAQVLKFFHLVGYCAPPAKLAFRADCEYCRTR